MRDGDAVGCSGRKAELDRELRAAHLEVRTEEERIATPVPTWSIETWLLCLTGQDRLVEDESYKNRIPQDRDRERGLLRAAADAWFSAWPVPAVPSLEDGREELARLGG